jgi:hypothetical protein
LNNNIRSSYKSGRLVTSRAVSTIAELLVQDERIRLAIVTANNHYAGFGPETANVFRNMLGLPEAKWEDKGEQQQGEKYPQHDLDVKQSTLSEFLD